MDAERKKILNIIDRRIDEIVKDTAHGKVIVTIQGGKAVQVLTEKSELIRPEK